MSWACGLVRAIGDSNIHIISTPFAVVMEDKFKKALHHYLVLPKEKIDSIFELRTYHLDLLNEMYLLACNIIQVKKQELCDFKIGFHAEPSMKQLHLHVISKDFHSPFLKTKKHWNSFNTDYFVLFQDLCDELVTNNSIKQRDKIELRKLLATELRCNQCDYKPISLPTLKFHLEEHWQERSKDIP